MGCAFAGLILLAAVGAGTLASLLLRAPQRGLSILVVAIGVAVALSAGFAIVLRGTARFFGRQDRLRRQLLADVAHELRTPLAILQGRIEGLIDGVYARDEESLRGLLDETRHLGRLVDDLGTLASAESGALDLRKEPVDLADLARDAAASFARPIAVGAPEDMPPIDVDPVRIREVLLNLLGNALDSTPEDGEVAVRIEPLAGRVVVRVIDTGRGIPAEELPRVFDRFRKGAGSRGSGLGLAIARDLVRAHGGRIAIESTPGRGTTVTVELPA
jgi:signal transduction histidine kinase